MFETGQSSKASPSRTSSQATLELGIAGTSSSRLGLKLVIGMQASAYKRQPLLDVGRSARMAMELCCGDLATLVEGTNLQELISITSYSSLTNAW